MSRKREPVAVTVAEGGVLVKHTDDVALASRLARLALAADYYDDCEAVYLHKPDLGCARVIWCRIGGVLPGSLGEGEGWSWQYHYADGPGRGAFRAVEFIR